MATVYKIKRLADGLYSTGGVYPKFTAKGKVWRTKAALGGHLAMHTGRPYVDCVIEEIEITERVADTRPVSHWYHERAQRLAKAEQAKQIKQAELRLKVAEEQRQRDLALLAELKKKYPETA